MIKLGTTKRGAASELIACSWLLEQGYEVFRNVTPTGSADIVVWKDSIFIPIDITTATKNGNSYNDYKKNKGKEVRFIYVLPDKSCKWREDLFAFEKKICVACGNEYESKVLRKTNRCNLCLHPAAGKN